MLFKSKPKRPIDEVFQLIGAAEALLYTYLRDKNYQPTQADLELFTQARAAFYQTGSTADYIEQCLHRRFYHKPEGSAKWHDKASFDYHYPP